MTRSLFAMAACVALATAPLHAQMDSAGATNALTPVTPPMATGDGPQAGQKVAFLGDSITQFGTGPGGYVTLVGEAMKAQGREITIIPAGVSGNTSKDMLARLDRDVLSKKPDWMTLSCGVNDVWHGVNGVALDQYKLNITSIVDQATAAGIKVVILTSTMIREDQTNADNQKLAAYNDFLRQFAADRHLPLADLNAAEQAELDAEKAATPNIKGNVLTVDGVHMNALGNEMMAGGVMKAFGFNDAQVAQAKADWMTLPNTAGSSPRVSCTAAEYLKLRTVATAQGQSVDDMLTADLARDVQGHLAQADNPPAKP